MSTTRTSARLAAAIGAIALSGLLAACGGGTESTTTTEPAAGAPAGSAAVSAERNDADVRFAQMMIPHHRQAVEMAQIALDRAESPEVKELAEQIRSAQDPEIATMTGFLQAWGVEVPAAGSVGGMGHGGTSGVNPSMMSGMMTPEQMGQLGSASGAAFDMLFLQMMIVHHEGAIADSQRELTEGINPQAKELATQIVSSQTAEITRIQQLLQTG